MKIRYFDHAATTPVREEVIKEIIPYFGVEYGNPSSIYTLGRRNRKIIDESREKVAKAINAKSSEIYFTSCGSESDNLALKGIMSANKEKGKHLITTKIEHPAILNTCKWLEKNGYDVTYLNVDNNGKISLSELKNSIRLDTVLISIMFANNEIGTIQPIKEIGQIAKSNGIIFHTDAVQAIGNVKIDVQDLNIDALSMSGHKIYAPKGIGAVYIKNGIKFERIQHGGHQENNKRAGTENVAGIVGLGKAIELIYNDFEKYNAKLINLRDYYISEIEKNFENIHVNGDRIDRLPGNANISFKGIDAGELLLKLDSYGICASAGSACTSGSLEPSHVLLAIGLKEDYAQGALRVSFGKDNNKEDVQYLIDCIKKSINNLKDE
ncbi:MAG: cysteine desulfurase NifS [Clostridia bacterium]|nr:cysteine desulfurase NifS [Clostridia bacterium]